MSKFNVGDELYGISSSTPVKVIGVANHIYRQGREHLLGTFYLIQNEAGEQYIDDEDYMMAHYAARKVYAAIFYGVNRTLLNSIYFQARDLKELMSLFRVDGESQKLLEIAIEVEFREN